MSIHLAKEVAISGVDLEMLEHKRFLKSHGLAIKRSQWIGGLSLICLLVTIVMAMGIGALHEFLPSLPGAISHVWKNVYALTVSHGSTAGNAKNTVSGLVQALKSYLHSPLGLTIAVAVLLMGLSTGVFRQSAIAVVMGVCSAMMIYFAPDVLSVLISTDQGYSSSAKIEKHLVTRISPEINQASKLDVLSKTHALSPSQERVLAVDVNWIAAHPMKKARVKGGKYVPYPTGEFPRLLYRFSAPLPAKERPVVAQEYAERITAERRQAEDIEANLMRLDLLFGVVFLGGNWIAKKGKKNIKEADRILLHDKSENPEVSLQGGLLPRT